MVKCRVGTSFEGCLLQFKYVTHESTRIHTLWRQWTPRDMTRARKCLSTRGSAGYLIGRTGRAYVRADARQATYSNGDPGLLSPALKRRFQRAGSCGCTKANALDLETKARPIVKRAIRGTNTGRRSNLAPDFIALRSA